MIKIDGNQKFWADSWITAYTKKYEINYFFLDSLHISGDSEDVVDTVNIPL